MKLFQALLLSLGITLAGCSSISLDRIQNFTRFQNSYETRRNISYELSDLCDTDLSEKN